MKEFKEALKSFNAALQSGLKAKKRVDAEMGRRLKTATKAKGSVATSAPKSLDKLFEKMMEVIPSPVCATNLQDIAPTATIDGKALKALKASVSAEIVQYIKGQSYFCKAVGWQRKHSEQSGETMALLRGGGAPQRYMSAAPQTLMGQNRIRISLLRHCDAHTHTHTESTSLWWTPQRPIVNPT